MEVIIAMQDDIDEETRKKTETNEHEAALSKEVV